MNMKFNRKFSTFTLRRSSGMTILDVLLGIVIFVVGMLALASLQGNLTRSTAEGNARTVATNIAEEMIEQLRVFGALRATASCPTDLTAIASENVYQCITDASAPVNRNGLNYTVAADVTDWYFMPDRVSVTADTGELPTGRDTTISNFKHIDLTVSWNPSDFLDNEGSTLTAADLGAGSFTISGIIPSIPQLGAAEIAAENDGERGAPPVVYTPGARPDVVAIKVADSRFKESQTPVPDVIRTDELVETWFDVITYNTAGLDAVYLRREEFLVVSCECEMNAPNNGDLTGFLPTVWNGESYTTGNSGEMVSKPYGTSANNQQSQYCDTCCRDHHDDTSSYSADHESYDPHRDWSVEGDDGNHVHYTRARQGGLEPVRNNGTYVEACRMVRKDGFMRVAQDFRMEGLNSFPAGYLDTLDGVNDYSDYVTAAVVDFYGTDPDMLAPPSDVTPAKDFPADRIGLDGNEMLTDTTLLPLLGLYSQQMRSRGIYIDQLGPEAQEIVNCINGDGDAGCYVPEGVTSVLEVLPFYDIQTTWLAWWFSNPAGTPVSVTSEEVKDNNIHSRGLAVLEEPSAAAQTVDVYTEIKRGNTGLTVTDPITPPEESKQALYSTDPNLLHALFLDVNGGDDGNPPPVTGYTWSGTFVSAVNQVDASSATVTPGDHTFCSRAGTSISCVTTLGNPGRVTITGYQKKQGQSYVELYICSTGGPTSANELDPTGLNHSAVVSWGPGTVATDVVISIESSACEF